MGAIARKVGFKFCTEKSHRKFIILWFVFLLLPFWAYLFDKLLIVITNRGLHGSIVTISDVLAVLLSSAIPLLFCKKGWKTKLLFVLISIFVVFLEEILLGIFLIATTGLNGTQ